MLKKREKKRESEKEKKISGMIRNQRQAGQLSKREGGRCRKAAPVERLQVPQASTCLDHGDHGVEIYPVLSLKMR